MRASGYDIIGDIHGCVRTLGRLLLQLGYGEADGVYRHATRKAVRFINIGNRSVQVHR